MLPNFSMGDRWQYSAAVLMTVVLALGLTAAAVVGFVLWSTAGIDSRAFERQSAMVAQVVQTRRQRILDDLAGVAISDDAVVNTKLKFDAAWVDLNIGRRLNALFRHNITAVLDADGVPLYLMRDGRPVDPLAFSWIAPQLLPLVEQVRQAHSVAPDKPARGSDVVSLDGDPAIAAAMPLLSSSGALYQEPGSELMLLSVLPLNGAFAERLAREYQFEAPRFSAIRTTDPERAVFPLLNASGRFVAFFEWNRDRPGLLMLRQTGPALTIAFLMAFVLVVLLLRQLHRSAAALEAGRREAEHQARHDTLTGLPNRASFDNHLAAVLRDPQHKSAHIALLMLDLDRFKQVNDTLGHQAGDALICAVGARLRDVVGPVMIARLGGDEFGILSVSHERPVDVMGLSGKIIDSLGHTFDLGPFKAHVGVSIGIATVVGTGSSPPELVRKADIALYEAKACGRNRAVIFEEHMNELLQVQHTIEAELRDALRQDDQLSVAFQPLVDQQTRKVIGAEALARWHHPKYGQISPARFIPVAENTGLIEALGDFVLRRACELGASVPGRTIAVNISPTQLRNPDFSSQVFDILHRTGMQPADLELEITESILLDDEHVSAHNLRTFRTAGIHIALDDFGTGYSSLSYLKRYPVDRIKIDRSFVSQLASGHVSVAITQAIVTLAHAMDIEVTAEGVETDAQADILGDLGCNVLQGFLFSGAVGPAQMAEIFNDPVNTPQRRRRVRAA
jgi:diguanylate cyclase (GGDEF)-like protein